MANAQFDLPIRGTLKNPKIDGEALKEHWKAIGTDLLGNSMEARGRWVGAVVAGFARARFAGTAAPAPTVLPAPDAVPDDRTGKTAVVDKCRRPIMTSSNRLLTLPVVPGPLHPRNANSFANSAGKASSEKGRSTCQTGAGPNE